MRVKIVQFSEIMYILLLSKRSCASLINRMMNVWHGKKKSLVELTNFLMKYQQSRHPG